MVGGAVSVAVVTPGTRTAEILLSRWVTREDQAHARRYRRPEAQARSLLAHAALRALLARQTARRRWVFRFDSTGKLRAMPTVGAAAAEVSLSHSKDMVACAVSHGGAIGIDIEAHRPRAYDAIARYGFGPGEQAQVARHGPAAFYRIWTLREAMGKATGEGLALAADGRDHIDAQPEQGCWTASHPAGSWGFAHYVLEPGYSLALAAPDTGNRWRSDRIEWIDLSAQSRSSGHLLSG
ncbi:MAG TPA: 4'-phosphopantetheinyl transferase superfamily protein [Hypericibacter adhaerens]|jgi:4'-phosphopantetheinyl transferase|uniref:4'-phosphopantetheinyl transferase domain-containing protein n=1 Tax=Hypericibacter adhaerens TaxID=2602016 RepID=A0A5J6N202_9PROT|nr:4'-phosphopantetheinyl transferase superfamily protein [Hypericibacter adhaerens]QEX23005.1 hypothetical protein FRZ61_29400 [Hypericibacter adhaerens]HWA44263.1 4'-phosphopantetheinyl transferase superfamily protein [Hypericibacter adhaerens]